ERLDHAHDRYARLRMSFPNRRLNWRRTAEQREERRVNVQRDESWQIDDVGRQQVPVRDDDRNVGLERAKLRNELVAAWLFGLQNRQRFIERDLLDRRRLELG